MVKGMEEQEWKSEQSAFERGENARKSIIM